MVPPEANMPLLLTKTLRDLRHRTLRSLLTLVGIVVGVAGVVAISYTARNLAAAQAAVYADASQADLAVGAQDVSPLVRNVLERLDNVALVEGRVYDITRGSGDRQAARWPDLRLIAVDNRLLFRLEDPKEGNKTAGQIGRALGQRGVAVSFVQLRDPQNQEGRRELATLLLLLAVFSAIGAALSGFLVGNTVSAIMA